MITQTVTIQNKLGLHARAAAKLVSLASGFASQIELIRNGKTVNAKSIMGVMMLAAAKGTQIDLKVEGDDEKEAFSAVKDLIDDKFGEGE